MEPIDHQMAQRVWDRVLAGRQPEDPAWDLQSALQHTLADQSVYARLSRTSGGDPLLRDLLRSCDQCAACLRGLHILMTGHPPQTGPLPREEGTVRELLARCHSRTSLCLELCLRHQANPQCGPALTVQIRHLHRRAWLLARLTGRI